MRPWDIKVNCRQGRNKVTEVNLVGIDPNTTVSAVIAHILDHNLLPALVYITHRFVLVPLAKGL